MIFISLLKYFILTCLIEGGTILLISRNKKYVYYSLLCNVLTNPALNYIMMLYGAFFGEEYYLVVLAVLEGIVMVVEAIVYKSTSKDSILKSIGLSLVCNAASFCVGLLL